jgi:hypothetical protein
MTVFWMPTFLRPMWSGMGPPQTRPMRRRRHAQSRPSAGPGACYGVNQHWVQAAASPDVRGNDVAVAARSDAGPHSTPPWRTLVSPRAARPWLSELAASPLARRPP